MIRARTRGWALLLILLAVSVAAAACSSDESSGGESAGGNAATGEPILIGDVTSTSGVNIFPEPATIAHLVFDRYNAAGGLDGRPVELVSVDAQDTAEGAAAAAKQLLEEEKVVGFCCGGSIVDCTTNAGYYEENGVEALPGAAACAEAATVHPINTGPFLPTLHMLDFFVYDLGKRDVCFVALNVPLTEVFQSVFIPMWEEDSGITVNQIIAEPGEDLTPAVTKVAADGCEAVLTAFTEPDYQSFYQIASGQGLTDEIVFGMLTSGYSLNLLAAAGDTLEGVYTSSEFEPYTGDEAGFSDEVKDFIALSEAGGEPLTSFGEGGYIAANILIDALEGIEGDITFDSVQEAIRNIEYDTPMLGSTFRATGFAGGTQPNPLSQVLQVEDGEFVPVTGWQTFPRADGDR